MSAKAAETRATYMARDNAVFMARILSEIYTGKRGKSQIDVTLKCDSDSLKKSLESTKPIEEKLLRPTVQALKDMIVRKEIGQFDWVESQDCHTDLLTKKGAPGSDKVLNILRYGKNL